MALPLQLVLGEDLDPIQKARISYAFRVFCAVYGYTPSPEADGGRSVPRLCYGVPASRLEDIELAATYVARSPSRAASPPRNVVLARRDVYDRLGIRTFPCFAPASAGGDQDWLAEIFEWLSGADEYAVRERDDVGRVPYRCTLHGRFDLDPTIPYAAIAMHELNATIVRGVGSNAVAQPERPWANAKQTLIGASHDLDFIPLSAYDSAVRLLKNIAKAAFLSKDPRLAVEIVASSLRGIAKGRSPLNYLDLMRERERNRNIVSTYNVLCFRGHRRDANYTLGHPKVRATLVALAASGAEIALHGSYTSLDGRPDLAREFTLLREAGFPASGVRQHWLRHSGSQLYDELERVGARYDSTVGYSERAGFRSGACFPYPPYCFREERAYRFLEIPLAITDGSLYHQDNSGTTSRAVCERILAATRELAWGGVSVLWHNTGFEGGQLPKTIGSLYWELQREGDSWTTTAGIANSVWRRYAVAGLLSHHHVAR